MKLIIEKSIQIKQMEAEMKKMIQEKEKIAQTSITTMEDLPLTIIHTTTPTTAATGTWSNTEQLARSMEGMNLHSEEIKRLETQVSVI